MADLQARMVAGYDALEQPGDYCFAGRDFLNDHAQHDPSEYSALLFNCPACGAYHGLPIKPAGRRGWDWNGSVDKPTLSPSVLISGGHGKPGTENCRWHGHLRDGVWVDA